MSLSIFIGLLLAFISTFFLRHIRKKRKNEASNLPPGPRKLPIIGNLHQLGELPHHSLEQLSNEHGPLMFLQLGSIPTLVISSADVAREIFKSHDIAFSGRPVLYATKKISYGCLDMAFSPLGEYWRQVRKFSLSELLSAKRVQSYRTVREEEVALLIASVRHSSTSLVPINLSELMFSLVNNIVCRTGFGKKYGDNSGGFGKSRFHDILKETQALLGGFCISDFFPGLEWLHTFTGMKARLEKNFRELDDFYEEVIKEHLNSESPEIENEDFVHFLLRVQKDPSLATLLSRDHIKAILMDMLIAGTDTSSSSLVWTMSELIRNPRVMKRAQNEVRQIIGKKERVQESDLHLLNYLKLVVKESLRLHPPSPSLLPRETTKKCTVRGYEIPKRTRVLINARAIFMDRKCWENPEEFWPERFIDNSIDFKGQDFELIPFGVGRRVCPGIQFAVSVIELALANLLYCFNWELPHMVKREDVDMNESVGITTHKKIPLCLVATFNVFNA
ncbi:cytochrome P450 71A9-like [Tasmannia lanceolata]|uniref:cytochrome P450 71A9-like n=1 Tax=Tasmannia lanceolata TaxID=3420 RepID=UPI0040632FFC